MLFVFGLPFYELFIALFGSQKYFCRRNTMTSLLFNGTEVSCSRNW